MFPMLTRALLMPERLPPIGDWSVFCTVKSAEELVAGAEDEELEL